MINITEKLNLKPAFSENNNNNNNYSNNNNNLISTLDLKRNGECVGLCTNNGDEKLFFFNPI